MSYIPSVNIEYNSYGDFQYIVTENAKLVMGRIVNGYNAGNHSFNIVGTYGTGKSSFLVALEHDLTVGDSRLVANGGLFGSTSGYQFLNIVGDYAPLSQLLMCKLHCERANVIESLASLYQQQKKQGRMLVIVIDEFGKILEHAANNNPEQELYFLQKLAEFVNVPTRKILLLTTLHQNFGSYAAKLTETQRNEWQKVKGRFQEVVFAEPVERLLYLAAMHRDASIPASTSRAIERLFHLGKTSRVVAASLDYQTVERLYPLDPISAVCMTIAIQRYGQNERSLFSFLTARGADSVSEFVGSVGTTYNVACVYDYIKYHYYSALAETNADSVGWRAISVAIERIEGSQLSGEKIVGCLKLAKTIGVLNLFFSGITVDDKFLSTYGHNALGVQDTGNLIEQMKRLKIVRYATYKSQYILYEGTDLNIEDELYKASTVVPVPMLTSDEVGKYLDKNIVPATATYYRTGTPRFFEYIVENEPTDVEPAGDIDGLIHLVFPLSDIEDEVVAVSANSDNAAVFVYFRNVDKIKAHLYEIKKLQYVRERVAIDDRVAKAELDNQMAFEAERLQTALNDALTNGGTGVVWYFKGSAVGIFSVKQINQLLSAVCEQIYYRTPIIRNELFNRQKLSSAISLARVNLLDAMLAHADAEDFGFDKATFPPEKTIYYTLFRETGVHRQDALGNWILGEPLTPGIKPLWDACKSFIDSSADKPRRLTDLVKLLLTRPYKLKQGVIDFWLPIFLYANQQDFALYNGSTFVLNINKEVFELLQKRLSDFSVKAFRVSGVKLEFFRRYREFLHKDEHVDVTSQSLIDTIKPFFHFYRSLNNYAKHTRKFDNPTTAKFRDVLSSAQDPGKTFFEDLPVALGYRNLDDEEFVAQYVDMIRTAVRDLNACYDLLVDRIERKVVDKLGLPKDFDEYKPILERRYQSIDKAPLTPKVRAFLERILAPSATRSEFYEKISIIVTDKRLDATKDSEESLLINNMLYLFSELERYSAITTTVDDREIDEAFNFELASSRGRFAKSQTFRLPISKKQKAIDIGSRINELLSKDDNELNVCILLKLLNERLG